MMKTKPYCLWFTGMPNSGKTTIAYYLLQKRLRNCVVIDGDKFRETVNPHLTFTRRDIIRNNKDTIRMVKFLMGMGFNVIVAMITPFQVMRDLAKREIANYFEVYLSCPISVRRKRPNFIKSQIKYQTPAHPHLVIHTDKLLVEDSVDRVLKMLERRMRGE